MLALTINMSGFVQKGFVKSECSENLRILIIILQRWYMCRSSPKVKCKLLLMDKTETIGIYALKSADLCIRYDDKNGIKLK